MPNSPSIEHGQSEASGRHRLRRLLFIGGGLALPVALAVLGYLCLGFHLGNWNDDWFLTTVDPATGERKFAWPNIERQEFWRPLHLMLVYNAGTFLWESPETRHVLTRLSALLAAFVVWRMLRVLLRSPWPAAAGGLLFLAYPMQFEVAFWPAAISTPIAIALFALTCILVVRLATKDRLRPRHWLALGALPFVAACFNEQPVAGLAPIGLLVLAARRSVADAPPLRRDIASLKRAAGVTLAVGLGCVAYVVPFLATRDSDRRGSIDDIVAPGEAPQRFVSILTEYVDLGFGPLFWRFIKTTTSIGWDAIIHGQAWTLVVVGLAVALWGWRWGSAAAHERGAPTSAPCHAGWLVAFAASSILTMLFPVAFATGHGMAPRMTCPPFAAASIIVGVLVHSLLVRAGRFRRPVQIGVALAVAALAVAWSVSLFGMQREWRDRARRDERLVEQLAALVPEPPENCAFICLRYDYPAAWTRTPPFDRQRLGVLGKGYAVNTAIRHRFARGDVHGGAVVGGSGRGGLTVPGPRAAFLSSLLGASLVDGHWAHLETAVPYVVDSSGRVVLVSTLWVEREDHADFKVDFPVARGAAEAAGQPNVTFVRQVWNHPREPRANPPVTAAEAWAPVDAGGGAKVARREARRVTHPSIVVGPGGRVQLGIGPSERARRLLFRATVPEDAIKAGSDGVDVRVLDEGGAEIARIQLTASRLNAERRWVPMRAVIPPGVTQVTLEVLPRQSEAGDVCWITPAFVQAMPEKP